MKTALKLAASGAAVVIGLVVLSNRSIGTFFGYVQATADTTVDAMEESVPTVVRDRKLENDIAAVRDDVIDRQVKLSLAETEVAQLTGDVANLESSIERRKRILADAYPKMQRVTSGEVTLVSFAGEDWSGTDFASEIDRLLDEQQHDERQLEIRTAAMTRLQASVAEGRAALREMQSRMAEAEQEFQALVARREQAENEAEVLDLITDVGRSSDSAAAGIGQGLDDLRSQVERSEAHNKARRDSAPAGSRPEGRLTRAWERLERLQQIAEQAEGTESPMEAEVTDSPDNAGDQDAPHRADDGPVTKRVTVIVEGEVVEQDEEPADG